MLHWDFQYAQSIKSNGGNGSEPMNQFYQMKFKELFIEFTRYLTEHPEFAAQIPKDAQVVLLDSQDPHYSLQAIQSAQRAKETDEIKTRPVVYIEVKEMAPVQSRLLKVNVLTSPPVYA
jgi:hypothetical protein